MSKGSRKKRETRPWQHAGAMRDLGDISELRGRLGVDDDLELPGYEVRRVDPTRALKGYVCPECGNTVAVGEGHVVVWPEHDSDLRRHWHKHCWRFEVRRSNG
jgi:hypothetical protein